jgi:hypothetical protein
LWRGAPLLLFADRLWSRRPYEEPTVFIDGKAPDLSEFETKIVKVFCLKVELAHQPPVRDSFL